MRWKHVAPEPPEVLVEVLIQATEFYSNSVVLWDLDILPREDEI